MVKMNGRIAESSIAEEPESPGPAPTGLPSFNMGRRHSEQIARKYSADSLGNGLGTGRRHSENSDTTRKKISDGGSSALEAWLQARRLSEAGVRRMSDASVILTEDTDRFIIGDRVWVGGTKPGQIAYIGETQFAPGEWAGVVLDEPVGKNDGSVAGVRYFMCEPKRGVFSRLTKLTLSPLDKPPGEGSDGSRTNGSPTAASKTPVTVPTRKITPSAIKQDSPSPSGSTRDIRKSPSPSLGVPASNVALSDGFKVGDRVIVTSSTGTKVGVLRYIGTTDFAAGEWAGVELHDPLGKNDGSVAGKRYFQCKPNYGLFAPVHKVSRSPASRRTSAATAATPAHRPSVGSVGGMRRQGSKDSISSMSSTTSVGRATRKSSRPATSSLSATHNALQESAANDDDDDDDGDGFY